MRIGDRKVEVIETFDAPGSEHLIEFHFAGLGGREGLVAVALPDGGDRNDAVASIAPRSGDVPAALLADIIQTARAIAGRHRTPDGRPACR
ncbi:hypothetical protein [Actinomadura parmotrematis]|uniref:Uncharacterized protein n=1 Tax=Actinomadura parmotrematis TaxID=2864039 RepID=A0ABS7FVM6_9ACTN|nr:hypothetical protein [Actinomadura parmotrematis]MBW8484020.1 hypothetical protein [Actinomadura parmotrematis]